MNQLVIVGNGFDLAHGLKTSYADFIHWYLNKIIWELGHERKYSDLINDVELNVSISDKDRISIKSIQEYHRAVSQLSSHIHWKKNNPYFKKLLETLYIGWMDLEYFYYLELIKIHNVHQRNNRNEDTIRQLKELNTFIIGIKELLQDYLQQVQNVVQSMNKDIFKSLESRVFIPSKGNKSLFVNFNYTNTLNLYSGTYPFPEFESVFIHGALGNSKNPLILGYGDEHDEHYRKIEETGIDAFLENIKSFWYLRTNNYRHVMDFIGSEDYQIRIVGHSCGPTDRVLLSTLFNHPNCKTIDILYHDMGRDLNDYNQRIYAISRQFPLERKGEMRRLIIPFEEAVPIIPWKDSDS